MLAAVFPGAEPEQYQMNVMLTRLSENGVHLRVVNLSRLRLELLPVDWSFEGVCMEVLDGGPHLGERGRPVAGVVRLHAQHQKRRAIHEQGVSPIILDEAWDGMFRHLSLQCKPGARCRQNGSDDDGLHRLQSPFLAHSSRRGLSSHLLTWTGIHLAYSASGFRP